MPNISHPFITFCVTNHTGEAAEKEIAVDWNKNYSDVETATENLFIRLEKAKQLQLPVNSLRFRFYDQEIAVDAVQKNHPCTRLQIETRDQRANRDTGSPSAFTFTTKNQEVQAKTQARLRGKGESRSMDGGLS